jgi:hypothetical protein
MWLAPSMTFSGGEILSEERGGHVVPQIPNLSGAPPIFDEKLEDPDVAALDGLERWAYSSARV